MLTQRMLMGYALVGMNIKYKSPSDDLLKSVELFDRQLADLKAFKSSEAVTKALETVGSEWKPLRGILVAAPNKEQALALREGLDNLLKASHQVVVELSKASGSSAGEIINTSGRQRMLSQRMAALYALGAWRLDGFKFMPEFKKVVAEFSTAHSKLLSSSLTNDAIKKELDAAGKSFKWFEHSAKTDSDKFIPSLILRASDRILEHMNNATKMYAKFNG